VTSLLIGSGELVPPGDEGAYRTFTWTRLRRHKKVVAGAIILLILAVVAIFGPLFEPFNPLTQNLNALLSPPSHAHLLGTDDLGRDVLSRVISGTRLDLQIAFFGTIFCFLLGCSLGLLGGYFGGWVDLLVGRLIDVVQSFPSIVVIIALIAVLGVNLINVYLAITVTGWTAYARLTRAEVLRVRALPFVEAAEGLDLPTRRVLVRHIVPNVITAAVTFLVIDMMGTVLLVTSLSFLGLGPQPPTPEWGAMIAEAESYLTQAWWVAFFPGLAILITGVGLSLLGDGLTELLREG
jgi:peptide/nickel transport system permease protein